MTLKACKSDPVYDARRVAELLGLQFSEEELNAFGTLPESLEDFVTFFDPGWSLLRLRETVAGKGTIFYPQSWYNTQDFVTLEGPPRYRQLRMEAMKDSFDKTFADQQKLLLPDEEVPLTRVVVMGMVLHFLVAKERLFPTSYVRCQDKASGGDRVSVGHFDGAGLHVHSDWDDNPDSSIGLASARKS
jgi:hypothetical protein